MCGKRTPVSPNSVDQFTNYTTKEGLTSNEVQSLEIDNDAIWFGTIGGGLTKLIKKENL